MQTIKFHVRNYQDSTNLTTTYSYVNAVNIQAPDEKAQHTKLSE